MINIKIRDELFHFPQNFSELTLGKFQRAMNITYEDEIDSSIKIISVLADIPIDLLEQVDFVDFKKLIEICKFLNETVNDEPKMEIIIDNKKYGMFTEISKMTTGEFIDLDTLIKDPDEAIDHLHVIMAILYRPIDKKGKVEKYDSETVEERAKLFQEKMTVDCALAAMSFSMAVAQSSLGITEASLVQEQTKEESNGKTKVPTASDNDGAGS